ncbi:MAG: hypothetical protein LBD42_04610 [Desulfovibrio sp.]|nr:hypothetical protein [Desulfovibrio sp.]
MARHARVMGRTLDYQGVLWDVRESRPTHHRWNVLMGWPAGSPRGQGGGGPRVILTPELAAYLHATAMVRG